MKILLDMNIPPQLCDVLREAGWEAIHWTAIGDATSPDLAIFNYAKSAGYVILSHDLDFSAILSSTKALAPSVIQIRFQDVLAERFKELLVSSLRQFEKSLESGALVVIDASRSRARLLPIYVT